MSHALTGHVDINCSTNIMISAIRTLFPELADFIDTQDLNHHDYWGNVSGDVSPAFVIKNNITKDGQSIKNPSTVAKSDISFVRGENGKWSCVIDDLNPEGRGFGRRSLEETMGALTTEVAKRKVQEVLSRIGAQNVNTKATKKGPCVIEAVVSHESLSKLKF